MAYHDPKQLEMAFLPPGTPMFSEVIAKVADHPDLSHGPLDADEEPMFSRPERRRMERDGALPAGVPPVVTRIRVNAQGRLHLQAVDDEEGGAGGARRRAHRVRGHYMRTAKGVSWRKAHVRGLGQVNETVRVVGAAKEAQASD